MFNTLGAGHIGIHGKSLPQLIELASTTGFEGVAFSIEEAKRIADEHGIEHLKALFADADVRPGDWAPPVEWRDDEPLDHQIEALRPLAELAAEIGATSTATWILPGDNQRPKDVHAEWLRSRLSPITRVLNDSGIRFGLEFIGPKTLREQFTHEFHYTMKDMLEYARSFDTPNVGLLFDTFHFYTGGNDLSDLDTLAPTDIVVVHTNDAPDVPADEQQDGTRLLPMESGVINAPEMLRRIDAIGYEGPVETEPFNQPLRDLAAHDPAAAARKAFDAQIAVLKAAGLR